MIPSELKKQARESLKGNWGKAILIFLAYFLLAFTLDYLEKIFFKSPSLSVFYSILEILIVLPASFGFYFTFLKLKRHEKTATFDFIKEGFSKFSKVWSITFWVLLKMFLPICCFIIAIILLALLISLQVKFWLVAIIGVVAYIACIVYAVARGLLYSLVYYIAYDEPNLTAKEVVNRSEELMTGNRGDLFLLQLSFIGWLFLSCLTFGIAFIWVAPYMQVTVACFYDELIKR